MDHSACDRSTPVPARSAHAPTWHHTLSDPTEAMPSCPLSSWFPHALTGDCSHRQTGMKLAAALSKLAPLSHCFLPALPTQGFMPGSTLQPPSLAWPAALHTPLPLACSTKQRAKTWCQHTVHSAELQELQWIRIRVKTATSQKPQSLHSAGAVHASCSSPAPCSHPSLQWANKAAQQTYLAEVPDGERGRATGAP